MKRRELLQYIGNQAQAGGARHYELTDGMGRHLRAIDINSGSGLQYTVLPDRGMDISLASFRGTNLVYISPNGETHPAFYEPEKAGWLRTFTGGLLTTCGLTYLGPPVKDGDDDLGLHGRYSTLPAKQLADMSEWKDDEYHICIKGITEEATLFGTKLRLDRSIKTVMGHNIIQIADKVTNFGFSESPFTILYHMNFGYPLLSEDAELIINPEKTIPRDETAVNGLADFMKFTKPQTGFREQVFFHILKSDANGDSKVTLVNRKAGISVTLKFDRSRLPFFTQWKMMGEGDYVLGLEPGNVPVKNRKVLREEGLLPCIQPGETFENEIEIVLEDLR